MSEALSKPYVTELEAVAKISDWVWAASVDRWPIFYARMQSVWGDRFHIDEGRPQRKAIYDLVIAATALDMQALPNLFDKDQVQRLHKWIYLSLKYQDGGVYGPDLASEVDAYAAAFSAELARIDRGEEHFWNWTPMDAISQRLLQRWLGDQIEAFEVDLAGAKCEFAETTLGNGNPNLVEPVTEFLCKFPFVGALKKLKTECEIAPGNVPHDWDRAETSFRSVQWLKSERTRHREAMASKLRHVLKIASVAGVSLLVFFLFNVELSMTAPENAVVLVDPRSRSYFAPPCIARALIPRHRFLHMTMQSAIELGVPRDDTCNETAAFEQSRSIPSFILQRMGFLPSRWNKDGTWNW